MNNQRTNSRRRNRTRESGYPYNHESIINPFLVPDSPTNSARSSISSTGASAFRLSTYTEDIPALPQPLPPPQASPTFTEHQQQHQYFQSNPQPQQQQQQHPSGSNATGNANMISYPPTSPNSSSGHEVPSGPASDLYGREQGTFIGSNGRSGDHGPAPGGPRPYGGPGGAGGGRPGGPGGMMGGGGGRGGQGPFSPSSSSSHEHSYNHGSGGGGGGGGVQDSRFNYQSPVQSFREVGIGSASELSARRGFLNVGPGGGYGGLGARSGLSARPPSAADTFVSTGGSGNDYKLGINYADMSSFLNRPEDDDWLHEVKNTRDLRVSYNVLTWRGCMNIGFLIFLAMVLLLLFAGWPVLTYINKITGHALWGSTVAPIISQGPTWVNVLDAQGKTSRVSQSPLRGLIDPDTPASAMTRMSSDGKKKMKLVFSDEFNQDGRTFFEGDDPFWTAVDLHYWGTSDFEWYSPLGVTTKDGALHISLTEQPINNLNFKSGMLQSWNQICFQGGHLEVGVILPGDPKIPGWWPAVWMMSNLGRAGYGATNEGMWPYNYDSCDVGTMPNQTYFANGTGGPLAAEMTGVYVDSYGPALSYQYLATAGGMGRNSMSLQTAPFNSGYNLTEPGHTTVYDSENSMNSYTGAAYQQAVSAMIKTPQDAYQLTDARFATYGVEWVPHYRQAEPYITWLTEGQPSWRMEAAAIGPDPDTEIGQRLVPPEPMYIIFNLGMSRGFSPVDFDRIKFPGVMSIDYVRFWQEEGLEAVSCDGAYPVMPTVDYITKHAEAYWNANLTIWRGKREDGAYGKVFPGHAMKGECS
ncbi:hypothetical protein OC835_002115 [Tilletia horrida]|nr:hypothetical protein OC835_002115 [Tilletia horrida]